MGLIAVGTLFIAATVYYALNSDYGWLYALLFTALPAAAGLVAGIRELVLLARDRARSPLGTDHPQKPT